MRRWVWNCLSSGALMGVLLANSSDVTLIEPMFVDTAIYRIAILPICNPGTACAPELPEMLEYSFFKHKNGVASFIHHASQGRMVIKGQTTPWLRPHNKLKSSNDILGLTEDLMSLASKYVELADFDMFFFYAKIGGSNRTISFPPGQIIEIGSKELMPGMVFVINHNTYTALNGKNADSAILPSVYWAREFLQISRLHEGSTLCLL